MTTSAYDIDKLTRDLLSRDYFLRGFVLRILNGLTCFDNDQY